MAWDVGMKQGFISKRGEIPHDMDMKNITGSCVEECVLNCGSDPNCKHVTVKLDVLMADQPKEAGSVECLGLYTKT